MSTLRNLTGAAEISELHADRELAVEYLKCAMESLHDPNERSAGLLVLRRVMETIATLDRDSTDRYPPKNSGESRNTPTFC